MRRRLFILASAFALVTTGLFAGAAPAQASHSCAPDIPCYPDVCLDIKQKPYVTFCNG